MTSTARALFAVGQLAGAAVASLWWAAARWGALQNPLGLLWVAAIVLSALVVAFWLTWVLDTAFPPREGD